MIRHAIPRRTSLAMLMVLALCACSGGAAVSPPAANFSGGAASLTGSERLAVADTFPAQNVKIFNASANGNVPPLITMSAAAFQLDFPTAVAFDKAGNLYVLNATPSVNVYSFSGNIPVLTRTIEGPNTGLAPPDSIAVDGAGQVYVASAEPPFKKITEYPAGASGDEAPIATIHGPHTALLGPVSLATDSSGNLYATAGGSGVLEFAPGSNGDVSPKASISGINSDPLQPGQFNGIAVDGSDEVYVRASLFGPGCDQAPAIVVYASGLTTRLRVISGTKTGLTKPAGQPNGLTVDAAGTAYTTNAPPLPNPSHANAISVFAPGASGNVSPIATIAGSATGLFGSQESLAAH